MCRVVETTLSYSGCKLELPDLEPAAANVDNPLPKSFIQRITTSLSPGTASTSTPSVPLNQVDNTTSCSTHIVKQMNIFQCQTAFEDATQTGREQKDRKCAVLKPMDVSGGLELEAVGEPVLSTLRGVCPVCKAAEDAVRGALRREVIVGPASGDVDIGLTE